MSEIKGKDTHILNRIGKAATKTLQPYHCLTSLSYFEVEVLHLQRRI